MWWCITKILSSESSYGYTCTIHPKIDGWNRPPAALHASAVAIDQKSEIKLTRDVAPLLDINSLDLAAGGPGLVRDQVLAEQ